MLNFLKIHKIKFEEQEVDLNELSYKNLEIVKKFIENAIVQAYNRKDYVAGEAYKKLLLEVLSVLDYKNENN